MEEIGKEQVMDYITKQLEKSEKNLIISEMQSRPIQDIRAIKKKVAVYTYLKEMLEQKQ